MRPPLRYSKDEAEERRLRIVKTRLEIAQIRQSMRYATTQIFVNVFAVNTALVATASTILKALIQH